MSSDIKQIDIEKCYSLQPGGIYFLTLSPMSNMTQISEAELWADLIYDQTGVRFIIGYHGMKIQIKEE